MSGAVDHRPDLRLAGLLFPLLVIGPGAVAVWGLGARGRLPDPVAHHWGATGEADGFSSLEQTLALLVGMCLVMTVPLALGAVFGRQPRPLRSCLAWLAAWLAVFVPVLVADSLRTQLDLTDAADAPAPGPGILVAVSLAVVIASGVAAVVRSDDGRARADRPPPSGLPRLDPERSPTSTSASPSGDEPAADGPAPIVWSGRVAGLDRSAAVGGAIATAVLLVVSLLATWWLLPLAVAVGVAGLCVGRLHARIDARGLTVGFLGRRVVAVDIAEVAQADVVELDPFWEFGGWGLRVDVAGRVGVVGRRGPALRVRRGDGSEVLVTLDGADEAASALNSLADRLHA